MQGWKQRRASWCKLESKRKMDMVKMGGKRDNRLVSGTLQGKDEMLDRYERGVM